MYNMTMLENICYINLVNRQDRKTHVLRELGKLGITEATRIDAIKHTHGALGCTKSHIIALELAKERRLPSIFICEDDITFLNPNLLLQNLRLFEETVSDWDVLIIGGNNNQPYQQLADFYCKVTNCQTTTGYIVKAHYYDTLILNFSQSAIELEKDPTSGGQYSIDIYWKILQVRDLWYMITPPSVIQFENYSDIGGRVLNYDHLMLDMKKTWLSAAIGTAGALTAGPGQSPLKPRSGEPSVSQPAIGTAGALKPRSGEPSVTAGPGQSPLKPQSGEPSVSQPANHSISAATDTTSALTKGPPK